MDRSNIITLIARTYKSGSIGQRIPTETSREVFCNVSSVSGEESLEAGREGIKAAYRITMFAPDYDGEEIAEFGSVRYGIYRTYLGKNDTIELYLEKKAGVQ